MTSNLTTMMGVKSLKDIANSDGYLPLRKWLWGKCEEAKDISKVEKKDSKYCLSI